MTTKLHDKTAKPLVIRMDLPNGGTEETTLDVGELDELYIGDWLAIERMDKRRWWMRIGPKMVSVDISRSGKVSVLMEDY